MLSFEWPWILALLPLPLLARWLLAGREQPLPALKVPGYHFQDDVLSDTSSLRGKWLRLLLLTVCWIALLTAAARPVWIGEPIALPTEGRDLLLAVDISNSMVEYQDMEYQGNMVDRLVATKKVVGDFVERRNGDRMGLILFGSRPYLQTPLTFDKHTLQQLLNEAQAGFAGPQTAIGDAIGLAVKRLMERPAEQRVMILLTDGANTAGEVQPLQAAELASSQGIRIYTIGVGAESQLVNGFFSTRRINPSASLDETTLQQIAEQTGGQYFRARSPDELEHIYHLLDQLEPIDQEAEVLRPTSALFFWPLGFALTISLLLVVLARRQTS